MWKQTLGKISKQLASKPRRFLCVGGTPIDLPFLGRSASSLANLLKDELKEEHARNTISEDFSILKQKIENVMRIEDIAGDMLVALSHTTGEEDVRIEFDCGEEEEEEEDPNMDSLLQQFGDENQEAQEAQEDEMVDDELPRISFTAFISRGDKKFQFDCVSGDVLTVKSLNILSTDEAQVPETAYAGPSFDELDESVQLGFLSYLNARHINDDLAMFIAEYAEYKEEQEYISFLDEATRFIK